MEQKEENVCGETTLTESGAKAQEEEKKEGSTVLGKFKDVDALARAYGALEAEFTRRSQRLKELERQVENLDGGERAHIGAEKLKKTAQHRKAEEKKFDEFLKDVEKSSDEEKSKPEQFLDMPEKSSDKETIEADLAEETPTSKEKEPEMGEREGLKENEPVVGKGVGFSSSEEVYRQAVGDEKVRLRIIGEYLASIGKTSAPITASGGRVLTTPPLKVKSFSDAGNLALEYFKKGTGEN